MSDKKKESKNNQKPDIWVIKANINSKLYQVDMFLNEGITGLGYSLGDLSYLIGYNLKEIKNDFEKYDINVDRVAPPVNRFLNQVKKGDIVLMPIGNKYVNIGKIKTGEYEYHPDGFRKYLYDINEKELNRLKTREDLNVYHVKRVDWIHYNVLFEGFPEINSSIDSPSNVFQINGEDNKNHIYNYILSPSNTESRDEDNKLSEHPVNDFTPKQPNNRTLGNRKRPADIDNIQAFKEWMVENGHQFGVDLSTKFINEFLGLETTMLKKNKETGEMEEVERDKLLPSVLNQLYDDEFVLEKLKNRAGYNVMLLPIGEETETVGTITITIDDDESNENENDEVDEDKSNHVSGKTRGIKDLSIEELKQRVRQSKKNSTKPDRREVNTETPKRDPYISELAKRMAKGVCQLCGNNAPFYDRGGNPYLETHHIIRVSKDGDDTIDNVVALCANCHRKMHILNLDYDKDKLKKIAKKQSVL
ncbi:HNH endonuclease [Methanohalobium evestigatum Z-7303]|uniref:HNH endonuclease n=1 Tax=Methanohalobium evestigatum (strain ATCC BAA-1072 / DSM 3721 / NBRC 107634 / OCM 161 / Z-7303) TaxID=644295 RepID=D7E6N9_METEZ|nr:HNH endonuclease [Methanohalobium evestigatum]ADI73261.1 HNH endonuclease [Methanohalobium evestigatum Z-7303]